MLPSDTHPSLIEALRPKLVDCRIREFHADDLEACVEIHRSNQPDLLHPGTLTAFVEFLAQGTSYILVVEQAGRVVACAGLELLGDANAAKLIQAMVHREFQRRGLGTTLLAARLSLLEPEGAEPVQVLLRARPAAAAAFYGAFGFSLHTLERDAGSAILQRVITPEEIEAIRSELSQRGIEIELNPLEDSPMEETPEAE